MIVAVVFAALSAFLIAWGAQLRKGRFLATIAGNNQAEDSACEDPNQLELGKRVGATLIAAGTAILCFALSLFFDSVGIPNLFAFFNMLAYGLIVVVLALVVRSFCWSLKRMK